MSHRGAPAPRPPRPPRKRLDPLVPLLIGAGIAVLALIIVVLYFHH